MRKALILAGLLITLTATYLFYQWSKRDTIVIPPTQTFSIPDSCWIVGSINIQQIKKDIAWSSILNGDFSLLFKADSSSSILKDIIQSPEEFNINKDSCVNYFGKWYNNRNYTSLLFSISTKKKLTQTFESDSLLIENQTIYSFRSKEGFWVYNNSHLLFVATEVSDSVFARSLLSNRTSNTIKQAVSGIEWANATINSNYIPDNQIHPLLDSTTVELFLKRNNAAIEIDWHYTGFATALLNEDTLTIPNSSQGFVYSCNYETKTCKRIIPKIAQLSEAYTKQQDLIDFIFQSFDANTCRIEFNGWKNIKSSYYTSVMNDEFEMVMQKKDTSFLEPNFTLTLKQQSKEQANQFIRYLQKNGLVATQKNGLFDIVLGSFDSALRIDKTNTIVCENKHHSIKMQTGEIQKVKAAMVLSCSPSEIEGLFHSKNIKAIGWEIPEKYQSIENIYTIVYKDNKGLQGKTEFRFKEKKSPLVALMQFLKK